MAIGTLSKQAKFNDPASLLEDRLQETSIYRFLANHGGTLFPDDYFSDLYLDSKRGRPTIPARVLATILLLQSLEGLSDRDAVETFAFDLRWQGAAGCSLAPNPPHSTVLVGLRNRLRASDRPRRLFEDTVAIAKSSGTLKSKTRVFDSTALYDSVATQDTVTQLRASIRKVLNLLPKEASQKVRSSLKRDDKYDTFGKPPCDWDDKEAREVLVDSLVNDALLALCAIGDISDIELSESAKEAVELLALVSGQDIEQDETGKFRIAKRVAKDRVISTVDTEARHGHKSKNKRFDGYKTHISIEPESEIICETTATKANAHDHDAIEELAQDIESDNSDDDLTPVAIGDGAYGDGPSRELLKDKGIDVMAKVTPVRNSPGLYTKEDFTIDMDQNTVTCPASNTVPIRVATPKKNRVASFRKFCKTCPLKENCTRSHIGRTISVNAYEKELAEAREFQKTPEFKEIYTKKRPIVERKIAHITKALWGGRKARTRGLKRVSTDVFTRCGVINLKRLAVLNVIHDGYQWKVAST